MNTYEREAIGNIVLIKNIIFENSSNKKKEIDHAWKFGRPCLIIYSDEQYDYILTITSTPKKIKYNCEHFALQIKHLIPKQVSRYSNHNFNRSKNKNIEGSITLDTIYKIPISGHEQLGKITFETYKTIINELKKLYQKETLDEIITKAQHIGGR